MRPVIPGGTRSRCVTGMACAVLAVALAAGGLGRGGPLRVAAAGSSNIGYVYDSSEFHGTTQRRGVSDCIVPGGSVFSAAIFNTCNNTNMPPGDTLTYKGYKFTNETFAAIDKDPNVLKGFDTLLLYEPCHIGDASNSVALTAINGFLVAGGKVIILDGDGCAASNHYDNLKQPDYSHFLFPFVSNNPGALGACGKYTKLEASTLTTGLAATYTDLNPGATSPDDCDTDAMGDSNVFVTFSGDWCEGIRGTDNLGNAKSTNGIVEAYARTASGGIALFEGEDYNNTDGPTAHLATVFDDLLAQKHNPDGLPCTTSASGITLTPQAQTVTLGHAATLSAAVNNAATGKPQPGVLVTFVVVSGPDAGKTGTGTTGPTGVATFTYTPAGSGVDKVQASFKDVGANVHTSNTAVVTINQAATTPTPTPTASTAAVTPPNTGGATPGSGQTEPSAWWIAWVLGIAVVPAASWAARTRRRRRSA